MVFFVVAAFAAADVVDVYVDGLLHFLCGKDSAANILRRK